MFYLVWGYYKYESSQFESESGKIKTCSIAGLE